MKGEYVEEQQDESLSSHHHNLNISSSPQHAHSQQQHINMFSKFSNHPKFLSPPPHFLPPQQQQPQFPQHQTYEDSDNNPTPITTLTTTPPFRKPRNTNTNYPTTTTEDCGATIEVQRRPRGRPPGSKNRPKPPVIITKQPEPAMSPYILELPTGSDIVDSLTRYTRRRGMGLCVLTASGAVTNVTLEQPSTTTPGGTVTFHGRFDILSLSAFLSQNNDIVSMGFTITVAGPQGQIVGGKVVAPLMCASTVFVVATSFDHPSYCRLPLDDHARNQEIVVVSGDGCRSPASGGDGGGSGADGGGGSTRMYSVQQQQMGRNEGGGDVVWAPTAARPPPPY